jgi:hypothetical protein
MAGPAVRMPGKPGRNLLDGFGLVVIQGLFLNVYVQVVIVVFVVILFIVVVLFLIFIVRDDVYAHRVHLHHFQFRRAFRTAEDFTFFHFFFVYVNFDSAFGAADHGKNLQRDGLDKN